MRLFKYGLLLIAIAAIAHAEEDVDEEVVDGEIVVDDDDAGDEGEIADDGELADADEEVFDDDESTGDRYVDIQSYFPEAQVSAGKVSDVLVSVKVDREAINKYTVHMIDGGFHYTENWGYKVQNFSSIRYARELTAGEEATFMYPFMAAELAGGRSYGLQLNIHYTNDASPPQVFSEAFYNQTVEVAENMDNAAAEQFFMFLTLVIFGGLIFVYFAAKVTPKKGSSGVSTKSVVETGTGAGLADAASWIPKEHMKTKTASPKTSPSATRRRKAD